MCIKELASETDLDLEDFAEELGKPEKGAKTVGKKGGAAAAAAAAEAARNSKKRRSPSPDSPAASEVSRKLSKKAAQEAKLEAERTAAAAAEKAAAKKAFRHPTGVCCGCPFHGRLRESCFSLQCCLGFI